MKMLESILNVLKALVTAINANTAALRGGKVAAAPKAETAADKKKRLAAEKKKAAAAKGKGKVKLADVKAKAKAIAVATPDPARCANQLREVVAEISEQCFNTADKKLDEFDPTALVLFSEALDSFVYVDEDEAVEDDDLNI